MTIPRAVPELHPIPQSSNLSFVTGVDVSSNIYKQNYQSLAAEI